MSAFLGAVGSGIWEGKVFSREFGRLWFDVLFIFALAGSAIVFVSGFLYFFGFPGLWNAFSDLLGRKIFILVYLAGCFVVALAIYDGQFVGRVKKSHWSKKDSRQD